MIKVYDFIVLKIVERRLRPKDENSIGSLIYKVLYIEIKTTLDETEDLISYISNANDFHIGYISKKDYEKINEGQLVKGIFDEKGKIKILN